jgi:hypothetical protein
MSSSRTSHISRLVDGELAKASASSLREEGPLVDVALHLTREDGTELPPVYGKALVDTGADSTAVDFTSLSPEAHATGSIQAQGVTSESITLPIYKVTLSFPGTTLATFDVERTAATPHLKSQGVVALIGRDVLSKARLTYDGPKGVFALKASKGRVSITSPPVAIGTTVLGLGMLGTIAYLLLREPKKP